MNLLLSFLLVAFYSYQYVGICFGKNLVEPPKRINIAGSDDFKFEAQNGTLNKENIFNYSSFMNEKKRKTKYFENIFSHFKNYWHSFSNNSNEPYIINKKDENSYTLAFGPRTGKGFSSKRTRLVSKDSKSDVFDRLGNNLFKNPSYWLELTFKGLCLSAGWKNFQNVSEDIIFEIVARLLIINNDYIIFNNYSCHNAMKINVSIQKDDYDVNEHLLYDIIRKEEFLFKLFGRTFVFDDFTSKKFDIFEITVVLINNGNFLYYFAYGSSLLALVLLLLFSTLYHCHNYYTEKCNSKNIYNDEICDAYKDDPKIPENAEVYRFDSWKEVDEDSLLTLDYEISSDHWQESSNLREKSQSVQVLHSFKGSDPNLESGRESDLSNQFREINEFGFSKFLEDFNIYVENSELNVARTNDDCLSAENRTKPESSPSLQASTESLGITRVEYIHDKSHSLKFETDL